MRFPGDAPVTPAKLDALRRKIQALKLDLNLIEEKFVRCSGPGGQKVNKTSSGVQLRFSEREWVVKATKERSQALNRFLALRELVERIEALETPEVSPRIQEQARIRKQKSRRRRRSSSDG